MQAGENEVACLESGGGTAQVEFVYHLVGSHSDCILHLPRKDASLAVAFLWCWWSERNKSNRGENMASVEEFQFLVTHHADEWNAVLRKDKETVARLIPSWSLPPEDFVKINCDGAYHAESASGGWGCIARDSAGDVLFAAAGRLPHASEALQAEAEAVIRASLYAEQMGMGRIIIETDYQILKPLLSSDHDAGPLGAMFREAKFILRMGFIVFRVCHISRVCNKPAHVLTALGSQSVQAEHLAWLENLPSDVARLATGDLVACLQVNWNACVFPTNDVAVKKNGIDRLGLRPL